MIKNKDGKEIRLIKFEDLCKHCMCNEHDAHKVKNAPIRKDGSWYIGTCSNNADGCDGYTQCETCPIWCGLKSVFVTNVL
jgi:hypothetical protein